MRLKALQHKSILVWLIALTTCGSGLVNLYSVINPSLPERFARLLDLFPLEFLQLSRFFVLLAGFALVISSLNILKRKQRAFRLVALVSLASIVFHLSKGIDFEEAAVSAILLVFLLAGRDEFVVKSADFELKSNLLRIFIAFLIVVGYGILGFWLLEVGEFNFNFHLADAARTTFSIISLVGDPQLTPQTGYAVWFTRSLYLLTFAFIAYAIFALFRPVVYHLTKQPLERARAAAILNKFGHSSIDFFKIWRDKSYFFSDSGNSFIAYRVAAGVALALGDPVGQKEEIPDILREFAEFCRVMDWKIAFHQATPDYLSFYEAGDLRRLKIGEDAIVDLEKFQIENSAHQKLRKTLRKFERGSFRFERFDQPLTDEILEQMRTVSDDWLTLPGRRERAFSLGNFDADYLRRTTVYAVFDHEDRMLAFVNRIPSYAPGETTFDLMRHLSDAPNGTMDFIFTKLILESKAEGFRRLSLGMAPLAGFVENPHPTPEERAVQLFLEHMNFLFSYTGLQNFKAKFTEIWEPRYLIYRHTLDLPKIGLALLRVSELETIDAETEITTEENEGENKRRGIWKTRTGVAVGMLILSAAAYFAWYELHPRPLPPPGKNELVLRGQPLDIYFFPATGGEPAKNQKVLFLPGDGGWDGLAITIAEKMADDGYDVYALDTKRYLQSFTTADGALTEPQVIDDIGSVAAWIDPRWGERVTLVGWSEGAGLIVLAASAPNRAKLYNGVVVLGLDEQAELGWKTADDITYFTGDDPDEPMFDVGKYLPQIAPLPLAIIQSSGDQFIPAEIAERQFAMSGEPKKYAVVEAENHAFSGNEDGLFQTLVQSLDWAKGKSP